MREIYVPGKISPFFVSSFSMDIKNSFYIELIKEGDKTKLELEGSLVVDVLDKTTSVLDKLKFDDKYVLIDCKKLVRLDVSGAFILKSFINRLAEENIRVEFCNIKDVHKKLIEMVNIDVPAQVDKHIITYKFFYNIGKWVVNLIYDILLFLSFFGEFFVVTLKILLRPVKIRINEICYEIENTGVYALPIVSLVGLLSGVVLAYQGAAQLSKFGANIFIVDLISISIAREMSPLLTSIMVAGRSGSAYTARIGSMMLNQEIDSLKVIGISPMELLVIPKFIAMMISLPLLIFVADIVGIGSGLYLSHYLLNLDFTTMLIRLKTSLSLTTFLIGLVKGIIFSVPIVLISCFRGCCVRYNSEELGFNTTMSVVNTIFVVIIIDAILSIVFQKLGI